MGELRDSLRRNLCYYLQVGEMSQKELANRLGVSQSAITNWIKGKNSPDIDIISSICDVFGIEITDLMGIKNTPPSEDADVSHDAMEVAYAYDDATLKDQNMARMALNLPLIAEERAASEKLA